MFEDCPGTDELRRWLEDRTESSPLDSHVELCPHCQQTVELLLTDAGLGAVRRDAPAGTSVQMGSAASFLKRLESTSPPTDGPAIDTIATEQPKHIGRYRIERILGEGAFGLVFLAHDEQLQRPVAVKVPHPHLVTQASDAEAYLTEARTVAGLDHPNIVSVYDVGSDGDYPCYVVSKFIEGSTLAQRIKGHRPTLAEAVELAATVAETLDYAHRQGLVHRDIKPGNLLLDKSGKPFVADFGLALREQDVAAGPCFAGTPAYMSPEQACGEGHRVDGRSDIFSLGVVFYELLVGRRPFRADSQADLMEQITNVEPPPPSRFDNGIPKELDRICLKALSKRASERYATARDMADDLRHWSVVRGPWSVAEDAKALPAAQAPSFASTALATDDGPRTTDSVIKIVPKGLRSFDANDADFFLELLPGPRDRDALPDSIRFWKTRIEETDADNTFSVGLIYGPSGCGKSSLVKAGLLPRLSNAVIAVYVEAAGEETEARLLSSLRKRCPALSDNLSLKEALAVLRRGQGIPEGKKVVIVLDQFEQWLHARKEEQNTELVQALRQCDGGRVQCVVMVRDDFWMAVTRFMRDLEVRLVEGQNSAAVDLFSIGHAEKVLAAFGRAFGVLPDAGSSIRQNEGDSLARPPSGEGGYEFAGSRIRQNEGDSPARPPSDEGGYEFVEQAVAGLAQESKVICVRLALFAEMMKGKAWTPASLKAVGGTEGVGVTFLEETFSAATAPPEHRYHQKAARAVLKALLPESGTDMKGHMRSYAELLKASGYASRPKDFDDLIGILDAEVRLITPTDPQDDLLARRASKGCADPLLARRANDPTRYYQLTHDYLVPSLRDWLTRKQKETRRGRAELLLADRAGVWNARPENRQLPSLWQWCSIKWLTQKKNWTPPQRTMMRKASRYHMARVAVVALILPLIGLGSWEGFGRFEARQLRDRLLVARTADVPGVVKDMASYRRWVDPLLQDAYVQAEKEDNSRKQLHASLALVPVDSAQVEYLYERLLKGEPQEVVVIRQGLLTHKDDLTDRLWTLLEDPKQEPGRRFRAACALAIFAAGDARWEKVSRDVAAMLVIQKPFVIAQWTDALKEVGRWLLPPLADFLVDEKRSFAERGLIVTLYGRYAADTPDAYSRLEKEWTETSRPDATVKAKVALAKKRSSIGVALLVMGRGENVWPLLKHSPDPTMRSYLIDRMGPWGVEPKVLISRFDEEKEVSIKRSLLLSLGEYGPDRLSPAERRNLLPRLLRLYKDDPDAGIHGAAEWLMRGWQAADGLKAIDKGLATGKVEGKRQWYLNRQGQTMVVVPKPGKFWMAEGNERHTRQIARSFALASKEVTVGSLKPNDLGLFDMYGNACEWCLDAFMEYGQGETERRKMKQSI